MFAHTLRKISFWIGIAAAAAVPMVPFIYLWLRPPKAARAAEGWNVFAAIALEILGALGEAIYMLLWMMGLAATAVVASLIAFIAAWIARESRRTKLLCWLPALLVVLGYGVLVAMGL